MSTIAIATLQTPWDCKWSRFGRMRRRGADRPAEGLWVCVHDDAAGRPIDASTCETCAYWEYEPPLDAVARRSHAGTIVHSPAAVVCSHRSQTERRLELSVRVAALALAAIFAGTGFVVLTRPLAIPLTIVLWMAAAVSFLLGMWGNFERRFMPSRSW